MTNRTKQQQQYQKVINQLVSKSNSQLVSFCQFIDLLNEYNIKFMHRDDLKKISRLFPTPLDKMKVKRILSYLQFHSLRIDINVRNYFVTMAGRKNSDDFIKSNSPSKNHCLLKCINFTNKLLYRLCGCQAGWFSYLGGKIGTNQVRRDQLINRINILLKNTQHYYCIDRIINYLTDEDPQKNLIDWLILKKKLNGVDNIKQLKRYSKLQRNKTETTADNNQIRNRNSYIRQAITKGVKIRSDDDFLHHNIDNLTQLKRCSHNLKKDQKTYRKKTMSSIGNHHRIDCSTSIQSDSDNFSHLKKSKFPIIHSYSILNQRINLSAQKRQRTKLKKNVSDLQQGQIKLPLTKLKI